ncbi:MAG: ABC transporter permease [Filifactor alocis]|nr:ABC transporter permease [Filifactor alocis]
MIKYILKRIVSAVITMLFIITITFVLMKCIPGDPFMDKKMPNPEIRAAMYAKYGLDKPLFTQYVLYLKNFVRGDFGVSYTRAGLTVQKIIGDGFPYSLVIGIYATCLVVFIGISMGIISALKQNKLIDRLLMILATLGATIPSFVLATGFLFLFSKTLGLLPAFGVPNLRGYIGPVITISVFSIAFVTRLTRTSVLEVLQQDYIRTARSKGISELRVIVVHALRNALLPIVTYLGPMMAGILTGSFVIEKVFGIPGIGSLFTLSIMNRDYTMIMGITVFFAIILIFVVLLVDILYVIIDPRIKYD